ncbi:Glutamine synthetase [Lasiodiplodia theobromae]|uniref:Glutamine synthetase n=1 Tax=Lasiodiplodia theobromae TaxID=45133 RepID=UPI0015C3CB82|nr:Glutamine synthetase [Lasiodiplodia theobromae]KAF4536949.1 Glutamine synthetase [Lasiodiplodia theobromae]
MVYPKVSIANLEDVLQHDIKVKVAGIDADGVLRGKIMSKTKFLAAVSKGFGMSSAIFCWDMHDETYNIGDVQPSEAPGYGDFVAVPDLTSFRRSKWDDGLPLVLLDFYNNDGMRFPACPRGLLKTILARLQHEDAQAHAGVELEFFNYCTPTDATPESKLAKPGRIASFLKDNPPSKLVPLTDGMFGLYKSAQPTKWPTEYLTKSLGALHGITPSFMAKPSASLPGNSGHIHLSLTSLSTGTNLFAATSSHPPPSSSSSSSPSPYPDLATLSPLGQHFLAGLLAALPDIMPLLAPTVNSYKRLVPNYWAPTRVSYGLEDRRAAVRVVAPPHCEPAATRFEVRVPGADAHPHYAIAACVGAGWRGVEGRMEVGMAPLGKEEDEGEGGGKALPGSLEEATRRFKAEGSVAREIFGDGFVEFYARTREHEVGLYRQAVTDWEVQRYIEIV